MQEFVWSTRNYEVSVWTLQDNYIATLKSADGPFNEQESHLMSWPRTRYRGQIQNGQMVLNMDGTQTLSFDIPMYIEENGKRIENPNWYFISAENTDGRVISSMRKIKVIFDKMMDKDYKFSKTNDTFEFIILKVEEIHEHDNCICHVECEGLAFHELGKVGYKISFSADDFNNDYYEWSSKALSEFDGDTDEERQADRVNKEPRNTLDYWVCQKAGIRKCPFKQDSSEIDVGKMLVTRWYYRVEMSNSSYISLNDQSESDKIYEEAIVTDWSNTGKAVSYREAREMMRLIEVKDSNLYNITQTIAEAYGVFCRYEYYYDDSYHIVGRCIVFYNNYLKEDEGVVSFLYPDNAQKISRTMDSTDITTKMFVRNVINDTVYNGLISIMDANVNDSKEDYLLNFDYFHDIKTISDEQYNEIRPYLIKMKNYNDKIVPLQESLNYLHEIKTEVEAKITTLNDSLGLDEERITENSALRNALDEADGDADGYITIDYMNPDVLHVLKDSSGKHYDTYYVQINQNGKQGIDLDTLELYETYNTGATVSSKTFAFTTERVKSQEKDSNGNTINLNILGQLNTIFENNIENPQQAHTITDPITQKDIFPTYVGTFDNPQQLVEKVGYVYMYIGDNCKLNNNLLSVNKTDVIVRLGDEWKKIVRNNNVLYLWKCTTIKQINGSIHTIYENQLIKSNDETARKHINYVRPLYYVGSSAPELNADTEIKDTDIHGEWTSFIPTLQDGDKLWRATEYHFSTGEKKFRKEDEPITGEKEKQTGQKQQVLTDRVTNGKIERSDEGVPIKIINLYASKKSGSYKFYWAIENNVIDNFKINNNHTISDVINYIHNNANYVDAIPITDLENEVKQYILIKDEHEYAEGGITRENYTLKYYDVNEDGLGAETSFPDTDSDLVSSIINVFYLSNDNTAPNGASSEKWSSYAPVRRKKTQTVYECQQITKVSGDISYTNSAIIANYKINKTTTNSKTIPSFLYAVYKYNPALYYDQIKDSWIRKYYQDNKKLKDYESRKTLLEKNIEQINAQLEILINDQNEERARFERLMGPALRESYWQPDEEYQDYGTIYHDILQLPVINNTTIPESYEDNNTTHLLRQTDYAYYQKTGDSYASYGYDGILNDDEQRLYYYSGIEEKKIYYPCIDISNLRTEDENTFLQIYSEEMKESIPIPFSIVFNPTSNNSSLKMRDCKYYTLGSQAQLVFLYDKNENCIRQAIILIGADELSESELTNLKNTWWIGQIEIDDPSEENLKCKEGTKFEHETNEQCWIDKNTLKTCGIVYPRIKVPSLKLKTSEKDLILKLITADKKEINLKRYEDYYLFVRTHKRINAHNTNIMIYRALEDIRNNKLNPATLSSSYAITIKPEILFKYGITSDIDITYALSNADSSIYIDAKKILKENAYPKVSYDIDTIFWKSDFNNNLYTKLAQIIMINDTELKFKNTFGYISGITIDLDHQNNDKIEVKNYKTKFEDLFSKIVAQTEEMHKNAHNIGLAGELQPGVGISVPISTEAFETTVMDNEKVLTEFFQKYFDGPNVVQTQLESMWNEAGAILGSAARSLNEVMNLTAQNASILAGFRENVAAAFTPHIFEGPNPPATFKAGDIWKNGDFEAVATSPMGFTRTYDGTIAQIKGHYFDFNSETGEIDILNETNINLKSGKNIYIAAGDDVSIVGNNTVNIGGATINLGSVYRSSEGVDLPEDDDESSNGDGAGGIHLVASYIKYNTNTHSWDYDNGATSKVDVTGEGIELASRNGIIIKSGAGIDIKSSDDENVSVIQINKDDGILLSSTSSISLYSGIAVKNYYGPDAPDPPKNAGDYWRKVANRIEKLDNVDDGFATIEINNKIYYTNLLNETEVSYKQNYYYKNTPDDTQMSYYKAVEINGVLTWQSINKEQIEIYGANVELSSESLILGMSHVGKAEATAISMDTEQIVLAAGDELSKIIFADGKVTDFSAANLAGLQIMKNYIGMAVGNTANNRTLLSLKPTKAIIGNIYRKNEYIFSDDWPISNPDTSKTYLIPESDDTDLYTKYEYKNNSWDKTAEHIGPEAYDGSYLWLAQDEIYMGGTGKFTINTNNIKIQSKNLSEGNGTTEENVDGMGFALGTDLQGSNSQVGLGFWIEKTTSNNTTTYTKHLVVNATKITLGGDPVASLQTILDEVPYETQILYKLYNYKDSNHKPPAPSGITWAILSTTEYDLNNDGPFIADGWSQNLPSPANTEDSETNKYVWRITQYKYKKNSASKYTVLALTPVYEGLVDKLTQRSYRVYKYFETEKTASQVLSDKNTDDDGGTNGWSNGIPARPKTVNYYYGSHVCSIGTALSGNTTVNDSSGSNYDARQNTSGSEITITAKESEDKVRTFKVANNSWIIRVRGMWIQTDAVAKKTKSAEYLWSRVRVDKNDGTSYYKDAQLESELADLSAAGVQAYNIATGAMPVPAVSSSGLTVEGDMVLLGSTGKLALLGNSEVFIGSTSSNSAMIFNKNGISIGSNANIAICSGGSIDMYSGAGREASSKFSITPSGIDLKSAEFKLDITKTDNNNTTTSRFRINTENLNDNNSDKAVITLFKGTDWANASSGLRFTIQDGLVVKGNITATSFVLSGDAITQFNSAVDSRASNFTIDGISYISNWASTNKDYVSLTSTGGLLIGANNGIIIPSSANSASQPYLLIDENGIELNGKHIKINGQQEWSRDDIIVMNPNATGTESWRKSVTDIESHMNSLNKTDWVLIRPYYDLSITCTGAGTEGRYQSGVQLTRITSPFGDGASWYNYSITFDAQWGNDPTQTSNQIDNLRPTITLTNDVGTLQVSFSGDCAAIKNTAYTRYTINSGHVKKNLCQDDAQITVTFTWQTYTIYIKNVTLTCTCAGTTGKKVPCTVYYYRQ